MKNISSLYRIVCWWAFIKIMIIATSATCTAGDIAGKPVLNKTSIQIINTTVVPGDAFTAKIKELRSEKKGLNLETILKIKIAEEQQKDTSHSKAYYDALLSDITKGKTSKLVENSLINLYRRSFTEPEIDELIKFYKTSAGKKMDKEYILLMVESIKDAEQLIKLAAKNMEVK